MFKPELFQPKPNPEPSERVRETNACSNALGELASGTTTISADGTPDELSALLQIVRAGPVCVLSGAGLSTESGIPDYRGPGTRRRARNPIQYREFLHSEEARRRYWARSMLGWPRLSSARPNVGHHALAALEDAGVTTGLITQNVDGLHSQAGSRALVELHGALRDVGCLHCTWHTSRAWLQDRLVEQNGELARQHAELAPDGDADIPDEWIARFRPVHCSECGGPLRPKVVFFGENVPRERVDRAFQMLDKASSLLVVGSSLAVYSGLRFVHHAKKRGMPVAIICLGPTRGDEHARICIRDKASRTLRRLAESLSVPVPP